MQTEVHAIPLFIPGLSWDVDISRSRKGKLLDEKMASVCQLDTNYVLETSFEQREWREQFLKAFPCH